VLQVVAKLLSSLLAATLVAATLLGGAAFVSTLFGRGGLKQHQLLLSLLPSL
jgi:hypothetical protein